MSPSVVLNARTYVRKTYVRRLFSSETGDQPGRPPRSYVRTCVRDVVPEKRPPPALSPSSLALPIIVIVVSIVIMSPPSSPPHRCQAISQVAACGLPERLRVLL